jgi:hypothetical protein
MHALVSAIVECVGAILVLSGGGFAIRLLFTKGKASAGQHFFWSFLVVVGLVLVVSWRTFDVEAIGVKLKAEADKAERDAGAVEKAKSNALEGVSAISNLLSRVQGQSLIMELLAKDLSDGKRLLTNLSAENQVASNHLASLDEKTGSFQMAPDGRLVAGSLVIGTSWIVTRALSNANYDMQISKFAEAYVEATNVIARQNETERLLIALQQRIGDVSLSPVGLKRAYQIAAQAAGATKQNEAALRWASEWYGWIPSSEAAGEKIIALLNLLRLADARGVFTNFVALDSGIDVHLVAYLKARGVSPGGIESLKK